MEIESGLVEVLSRLAVEFFNRRGRDDRPVRKLAIEHRLNFALIITPWSNTSDLPDFLSVWPVTQIVEAVSILHASTVLV